MKSTRKLALLAALAAVALTIFVAEAQIPPVVPVPGVKLGLANIVTLVAMSVLGRKEAGAVFVVRLILGSAFAGGFSGLLFSAAGGAAAYPFRTYAPAAPPEDICGTCSTPVVSRRFSSSSGGMGLAK